MEGDRLQPFCEADDLEQRTNVESRTIFVVELGGGNLRHPDRYAEPLATRRYQVVGRRRPPSPLTNPKDLAR